jgi:hypothetical protein
VQKVEKLGKSKGKFKFVGYERSSLIKGIEDSSVSYCSVFAILSERCLFIAAANHLSSRGNSACTAPLTPLPSQSLSHIDIRLALHVASLVQLRAIRKVLFSFLCVVLLTGFPSTERIMRLLWLDDDGNCSLAEFFGKDIPPYAILSHRWGPDDQEVNYKDIEEGRGKYKAGYAKIQFCVDQAAKDNLKYCWIDTCCIDKTSSAELSEAINSMFRWYKNAKHCYVYLSDVSTSAINSLDTAITSRTRQSQAFRQSEWFTRGWTLQELLAPTSVKFYSAQGEKLGDRSSMALELADITGIPILALRDTPLSHFSVTERMLWAAKRHSKREEDSAYSLLGIFDVHMPLIYGEGREKAFTRLQKMIRESSEDAQPVRTIHSGERPKEGLDNLNPTYGILATTRSASFPDFRQLLGNTQEGRSTLELLRTIQIALPHILFILILMLQIPRSLSSFLPDNITLRDILGRNHSLPTEYFRDWTVLRAMLNSRFRDCPGQVHILHGSFTILDVDNYGRRISSRNWREVITKRKRFVMLINLNLTRLVNGTCARCGERVRKQGISAGACRSCGLFYKSSAGESNYLRSVQLRRVQRGRDFGEALHTTKSDGLRPGGCAPVEQEQRRLANELHCLAVQSGYIKGRLSAAYPALKLVVADPPPQLPDARETTELRGGEGSAKGSIEQDQQDFEDHSAALTEEPSHELDRALDEQAQRALNKALDEQEQRELQHFRSISLKQDSRLHDAACSGNVRHMRELMCQGHHVDENWGYWGTPLSAAVLSGSIEAIRTLLDAGADPLLSAGPFGYPLNAACLVAEDLTFKLILVATIKNRKASSKRAQAFQDAVDQALFTSIDTSRHRPRTMLLCAGANPFRRYPDGRSAFAIGLTKKDHLLTTDYLIEAWGKRLLTEHETLCLWSTVGGTLINIKQAGSTWLEACCLNLTMSRSKMLEDRIAARLKSSTHHFFEHESDWRNQKRSARTIGSEYLDGFGDGKRDPKHNRSWEGPGEYPCRSIPSFNIKLCN